MERVRGSKVQYVAKDAKERQEEEPDRILFSFNAFEPWNSEATGSIRPRGILGDVPR